MTILSFTGLNVVQGSTILSFTGLNVIAPRSTIISVSGAVAGGTITVNTSGEVDLTGVTINSLVYAGLTLADVTVIDADTLTATLPLSGFDILAANDLVLTADSLVSPAYSLQLTPKLGQAVASTVNYADLHPDSPLSGVVAYADFAIGDVIECNLVTSDANDGAYTVVVDSDGLVTITGSASDPDDQLVTFALHNVSESYLRSNESVWTFEAVKINTPATGLPAITGTATQGATLTATLGTLSDDNGITEVSNQWLRDNVIISGATASTYVLTQDDVGSVIKVRTSFVDDDGFSEGPFTSAGTSAVLDEIAPVITLNGASSITHAHGTTYTDAGATANDSNDGDLTSSIVVTGSVNSNAVGTYTLNYNVSDAAGNAATQVSRTINVTDQALPSITLVGASTINLSLNQPYIESGATASDAVDGNLTDFIVTTGVVDTGSAGTYTRTYTVQDAAGNSAQATRTINVSVDAELPVITLIGDATVTHPQGTPYTELGATATDTIDGDLSADIVTTGANFNVNTVGTYTVRYNVADSAGNNAVEVTRTVNVTDQAAPTITLINGATFRINVGETFSDPGATASDNNDGDLTADIVISGDTVDTNTIGSYVITYTVSDAAGNQTSVNRTVIVEAVVVVTPLTQLLTPENLSLDIVGEPGTTIKLFTQSKNRFSVLLKINDEPVDLSVFSRLVLKLDALVSIDSDDDAGLDWSNGDGEIILDIGSYLSGKGSIETTLLAYRSGVNAPHVLWHPSLASKLRIEKIEL